MDVTALMQLRTGDIVKSKFSGETYIVTANYGNRVTAVKTVDITHPNEWELIEEARYSRCVKTKTTEIISG